MNVHEVAFQRENLIALKAYEDAKILVRAFVNNESSLAPAAAAAFASTSAAVAATIASFDRTGWAELVILDDEEMHGARGAYDQLHGTIYLSRSFATRGTVDAIEAVLIEEIGHAIDSSVNTEDSLGDEGELFASYAIGSGPADLAAVKAQNDHGTILLGGEIVAVELAGPVVGSITLDGSLSDWAEADQIDITLSLSGYDLYAKVTGNSYVFAIKAPVAVGATTTVWLNTDQNATTGYKIWGFAGGAEYNINFDSTGTPRLYTGADGQTLVPGASVVFGYSTDRTVVEFAVSAAVIGSPSAISTLWDVNNNTFLPTDYSLAQFAVKAGSLTPIVAGPISIDGSLTDWAIAQQIDASLSVAGYDLYANGAGGSFVFAIKAPVTIGPGTTIWLNTDQDASTGYKIWGFAGGAEYNINFDLAGVPRLYTGADGQVAVSIPVTYAYSADHTAVELNFASSAIGNPKAINTLWDVNNLIFLPTDFSLTQYEVLNTSPGATVGSVTLDGTLVEWGAASRIDTASPVAGYEVYGKAEAGSFIFALKSQVAIGENTTVWFNTDQNPLTGFQIFGTSGGAEYNITIDAAGAPHLYTGATGQTLVPNAEVTYAYSADHKMVEFAISTSALGNPVVLGTLWGVNNSAFLPGNFSGAQYEILNAAALPSSTDATHRIGIVYSETTAAKYFSPMAYSQLFMAAQYQATMAGVPYDVLTESDLTNLAKLSTYDALVFPDFQFVKASKVASIENTLKLLTQQYHVGVITAGNFMTNDESGGVLAGDSYGRMKSLLDLQLTASGFPANTLNLNAADIANPMMQDYLANELIGSYNGVGWLAFSPISPARSDVLATQTVDGKTYNSVITTTTGGRNVHFSTDAVMGDNNLLWQAIDYVVNGGGVTAGLQLTRNASILASRTDMDQAQEIFDVRPESGGFGIYDKLIPILQQWKTQYNFVGSYYIDIGDHQTSEQFTEWTLSGPYYRQILAMGNELGSHSMTHPEDTNLLTAAQIQAEFQGSRSIIEQQMSQILGQSFVASGAAVPGMPESYATAREISKYYDYITGGYSAVGAGYPGAFGYLDSTLWALDQLYFAPDMSFDFTLIEFQHLNATQASAAWAKELSALSSHTDGAILVWPWHDYGAADWQTDGTSSDSPYTTQMFTAFIASAYNAGAEFVTLGDLAQRYRDFRDTAANWSISGNTVSFSVASPGAGKFAFDLDNLGPLQIASVSNWYAYDSDSVFLARSGSSYTITLGLAPIDVTHITQLPMRSELLSLGGDGTNLEFSVFGEGDVIIDLRIPTGLQPIVTGGTIKSLVGDILIVSLGDIGQHDVNLTFATVNNANHAPIVTSNGGGDAASVSVPNKAMSVTTVQATDVDAGQALTYFISGGADSAKFAIDAQMGTLTFRSAPEFSKPADQNKDNVYEVSVGVRDSAGATDAQAIAVRVVEGTVIEGGSNTIIGANKADALTGTAGNDSIDGRGGNDVITGGPGNDRLTGGSGADRFVFRSIDDGLDTITDFWNGNDVLDFREVLVGYAANSKVNDFLKISGDKNATTMFVNADGIGNDFVSLVVLQGISFKNGLLNDLLEGSVLLA